MATIYCGNALEVLKTLPDASVQIAMTSPPYWGLRNYSGGSDIVWGGNENCEHNWIEETQGLQHENRQNLRGSQEEVRGKTGTSLIQKYDRLPSGTCVLCGAWRGQLGLEPTPELYIQHMVQVFREIKLFKPIFLKQYRQRFCPLIFDFVTGEIKLPNPIVHK